MQQDPNPNPEKKDEKVMDKSLGQMKEGYQSIDEKLKLQDDDSAFMLVGKVLLRILLIIVMIALSPFLLVGLIFALIAAL